jgi:hypothetical protein
MSDHAAIVRLATRLGYKVYKEDVGYDSDRAALYIVKSGKGEFTGTVLNIVLARAIESDRYHHE